MQAEQEQRNDKRTPAAELSPELRNRLLCAMLDLQQEIRRNVKFRRELAESLQPEPPTVAVIARMKLGIQAELYRQRQNARAVRVWRRGLAVAGAVCAVIILLAMVLIGRVIAPAPAPVGSVQKVAMAAQVQCEPAAMAKVTRLYAALPLKQRCESPNELHRANQVGGYMCEDTLRHEGKDGSVLMIRVPNAVEFDMNEDVI